MAEMQPGYGTPFTPPPIGPSAPFPSGRAFAENQVRGPAVGVMIASGMSFAWYLLCTGLMLFAGGLGFIMPSAGSGADPMGGLLGGIVAAAVYGFFALAALVAFVGAVRMKSLKSYGLAMTSAIVATLPCTTYICCMLMMPFGIWSLIVLLKPEVKAEFR